MRPSAPIVEVLVEAQDAHAVCELGAQPRCARAVLRAIARGDDVQLIGQLHLPRASVEDDATQGVLHVHRGITEFLDDEDGRAHSSPQGVELFGRDPPRASARKIRQAEDVRGLAQRGVELDDTLFGDLVRLGDDCRDLPSARGLAATGLAKDEGDDGVPTGRAPLRDDGLLEIVELHGVLLSQ